MKIGRGKEKTVTETDNEKQKQIGKKKRMSSLALCQDLLAPTLPLSAFHARAGTAVLRC